VNPKFFVILAIAAGACAAANLNLAVDPGVKTFAGDVSEWPVPTPKFPRDPTVGLDGRIYFAVRNGSKIGRFDPASKRFQEWAAPAGVLPQGIVVTRDAKVVFGGKHLGELDPATGAFKQYRCAARDCQPYSLVLGAEDSIWFTDRHEGVLGKLDRGSGKITEYQIGKDAYGLARDKHGNIWVTRMAEDRLTKFDPATGEMTDLALAKGSRPRRIALAPDGMLWVALYGSGRLAKIDPLTVQVTREYLLPGGVNGGPYTVNVDAGGRIWVSEIQTDSVIMVNPRSETIRVFRLPVRDSGVRGAAIDAEGRYWYIGSMSGRLGVVN
jgi:virginiamycin B lyase